MSTTFLQPKQQLGWIGLGSMGLAMATNIQKHLKKNAQPALQYTNRTMSRGDSLKELGGIPYETAGEVVQKSDIIFISVSDDDALKSTISSILASGSLSNKIVVDTTTVHPNTTSLITTQVTEARGTFIAAPVFGSTPVAQAGQLLIATAGPPSAIEMISPFLKDVIARSVIKVGPSPSQALLLKTTSNFITSGLHLLLSEAHVLAEKSRLSASVLSSLIEQNFGAYAHSVSDRLVSGDYCPSVGQSPRSGLDLGIKDVGIGLDVAEEKGIKLRVGELCVEDMKYAKKWADDEGKGRRLDSTALFGSVRMRAGLDFESEVVRQRDVREKQVEKKNE